MFRFIIVLISCVAIWILLGLKKHRDMYSNLLCQKSWRSRVNLLMELNREKTNKKYSVSGCLAFPVPWLVLCQPFLACIVALKRKICRVCRGKIVQLCAPGPLL